MLQNGQRLKSNVIIAIGQNWKLGDVVEVEGESVRIVSVVGPSAYTVEPISARSEVQ